MTHPSTNLESFHQRVAEAVGDLSYRQLGRLTDTHPETARRYMQGQAPSAVFLINLCREFGISAEWLLNGRGPMKLSEVRAFALRKAEPAELLNAMAYALASQSERLARVESQLSLDTKLSHPVDNGGARTPDRPRAVRIAEPDAPDAPEGPMSSEQAPVQAGSATVSIEHPTVEPKSDADSLQRIRKALANRVA